MTDFPSIFVIAIRKRGQSTWRIGFRPVSSKDKAEAKAAPYREKHGGDYEYRILEYVAKEQKQWNDVR